METTQKYRRHPLCRFAARNRGMIATGNHYYPDSLRGAPPPEGAARKAPLKGELAGPKGLTEGFCGRHLLLYEISGEYVQFHLAPLLGELSSKARLRGAAGTCIFLVVRRIRTNHFLLPFNAPFKKEVLRWPSQSGPLGLPAPPLGEPRGPLRIRLGAFQMIFCVPPETPPARCAVLPFQGRLNSAPRWGSWQAERPD